MRRMVAGNMHTYLAELLEWYRGEVGGEAFFAALASDTGDPRLAAKWQKLAQLERHVADRLRAELGARGVPMPPATADLEQRGRNSAREYRGLSWREALSRLRPELIRYVREFHAAESRMPDELLPLAQFVTAHEQALLEFTTRELEQDGARSLDSILSLLGEAAPD